MSDGLKPRRPRPGAFASTAGDASTSPSSFFRGAQNAGFGMDHPASGSTAVPPTSSSNAGHFAHDGDAGRSRRQRLGGLGVGATGHSLEALSPGAGIVEDGDDVCASQEFGSMLGESPSRGALRRHDHRGTGSTGRRAPFALTEADTTSADMMDLPGVLTPTAETPKGSLSKSPSSAKSRDRRHAQHSISVKTTDPNSVGDGTQASDAAPDPENASKLLRAQRSSRHKITSPSCAGGGTHAPQVEPDHDNAPGVNVESRVPLGRSLTDVQGLPMTTTPAAIQELRMDLGRLDGERGRDAERDEDDAPTAKEVLAAAVREAGPEQPGIRKYLIDSEETEEVQDTMVLTERACPEEAQETGVLTEKAFSEGVEAHTKGLRPKRRSAEAAAREQERERMVCQARERPTWGAHQRPQLSPRHPRSWNHRHQLVYTNQGLNPNYRNYFDRTLDFREPSSPPLGRLLPSWRLINEAEPQDERRKARETLEELSPCNPRLERRDVSRSKGRKKPWHQGPFLEELGSTSEAGSKGRAGEGIAIEDNAENVPQAANASSPQGAAPAANEADSHDVIDSKGIPSRTEDRACEDAAARATWNGRHHVVWCNERSVDGKVKNPAQLRSYFDRVREPHYARCNPIGGTSVHPTWRLSTPTPEIAAQQEASAQLEASRGESSGTRRWRHSVSSPIRDESNGRWDDRHNLVFKNEEVSRLDRSYFDRWREPESSYKPNEKMVRPKINWSLEKTGSPEKDAVEVWKHAEERHGHCGKWNDRHHLMFCNHIHQNAKSYFDRKREPYSTSLPEKEREQSLRFKEQHAASTRSFRAHTESSSLMRRGKLRQSEKLPIFWKIKELSEQGKPLDSMLRRCDSEPSSKAKRHREQRRAAWFSSHDVVF